MIQAVRPHMALTDDSPFSGPYTTFSVLSKFLLYLGLEADITSSVYLFGVNLLSISLCFVLGIQRSTLQLVSGAGCVLGESKSTVHCCRVVFHWLECIPVKPLS